MTLDQAWPSVFTPSEARPLAGLQSAPVALRPRHQIARHDAGGQMAGRDLHYLCSGFTGRYRVDRLGRRQFLGIHLPGDFIDLSAQFLGSLDHDIDGFGAVEVAPSPRARLQELSAEMPELPEKLWRIALIDTSIERHWLFRVGRLSGRARVANFLSEMLLRLYARGLGEIDRFDVPLAQIDLAEICGMTPVHASRMVAELRDEGICTFAQGTARIGKLPELFQLGHYRWDYLHLDPDLDREIRERVASPRRPLLRSAGMLRTGTG